ncbi:succinate dehydrogenase assembly factor 2 [soil metagenome]
MSTVLNSSEVGRLKWQCRRGLLENDLFIDRFFARNSSQLTDSQAEGLRQLMTLSDPDLLDLFLARRELEGDEATPEAVAILSLMRTPKLYPESAI